MHIRQIKTVQQTNQIIMRDEPRVSFGPACALDHLQNPEVMYFSYYKVKTLRPCVVQFRELMLPLDNN